MDDKYIYIYIYIYNIILYYIIYIYIYIYILFLTNILNCLVVLKGYVKQPKYL